MKIQSIVSDQLWPALIWLQPFIIQLHGFLSSFLFKLQINTIFVHHCTVFKCYTVSLFSTVFFWFVYFNQAEQLSSHHSLNPSCNSWNCGVSEPCSTAWWKCVVRAHIQSFQTWMLFISVMSGWLWISPSLSSTCCAQQTGEVSVSWVLVSSCQSLWHRSASCRPSAHPGCTAGSPHSAWAGYDLVEMLFMDLVELLILIPLDKWYKNKCSLSAYWQWYLIKPGVSHRLLYSFSIFLR